MSAHLDTLDTMLRVSRRNMAINNAIFWQEMAASEHRFIVGLSRHPDAVHTIAALQESRAECSLRAREAMMRVRGPQ